MPTLCHEGMTKRCRSRVRWLTSRGLDCAIEYVPATSIAQSRARARGARAGSGRAGGGGARGARAGAGRGARGQIGRGARGRGRGAGDARSGSKVPNRKCRDDVCNGVRKYSARTSTAPSAGDGNWGSDEIITSGFFGSFRRAACRVRAGWVQVWCGRWRCGRRSRRHHAGACHLTIRRRQRHLTDISGDRAGRDRVAGRGSGRDGAGWRAGACRVRGDLGHVCLASAGVRPRHRAVRPRAVRVDPANAGPGCQLAWAAGSRCAAWPAWREFWAGRLGNPVRNAVARVRLRQWAVGDDRRR